MGFFSPFDKYVQQMDDKFKDKTKMEIYYDHALNVDKKFFTDLFLTEIKYRADHQRNIIASVGGQQGCGKSIFGIQLARVCAHYFGEPFDVEKHLFIDKDLLNETIRETPFRSTHLYDEQPRKNIGYGSYTTQLEISDYEEICRYTQKNLIYCSPDILDHKHYFVFEQWQPEPDKLRNETCLKCPLVTECKSHKYETICNKLTSYQKEKIGLKKDLEFFERDGYPTEFSFMLYTKRYADDILIPRGVVSFPMLPNEWAKKYDAVKSDNIFNFEKRLSKSFDKKIEEIINFVNENEEKLIYEGKKGGKIKPKTTIKYLFLKHFGERRFTIDQTNIMIEAVKTELQERGYK